MSLTEESLLERLRSIRPIKVKSIWVSATPFVELCRNDPPDWLYTSCKEGRYNPKGVACVYFAQDGRTARAEHACNGESERQPIVFYSAAVSLRRALDLTRSDILKKLGISREELFEEWERKKESATQRLGGVVSKQRRFSAILFPSAAAKEAGFRGNNLVIFRDAVRRPDYVRILGPTKRPLQKWP
jgi:RES domain-containing protein